MFDAHLHLQDCRFNKVLDEVVQQAVRAGIDGVCTCGTAPSDWEATALVSRLSIPFTVVPAFGTHPWYVRSLPPDWLEKLEGYLSDYPDAAVGEIGLDGIRDDLPFKEQEEIFVSQLRLAVRLGRSVVLHGARAWSRLTDALRPFADALPGFVAHGFGGSAEQLDRYLDLGGYVSVAGSVCNPRATKVRAVAVRVPADRLLVETDSPDLFPLGGTPVALDVQGKPLNQPANLAHILREVASLRHVWPEELIVITRANATRIFHK